MPMGINQDEAFAGYESYSILHYGKDTYGYNYPVYLTAWGSGMNALYSYLTMPFVLLNNGQLSTLVIRLPQCILACITLIVFYLIVKRVYRDKKMALIALTLMAINPWHIMLSRWGLEANIAPAFLMLGLYYWIKGIEESKYLIISALFYGLCLYCYAPMWIVVPITIIAQFAYSFYYKKIKIDKYFIMSILILFILALPLMLFVLVNVGVIDEIKTRFISIPKMEAFRSGELSLKHIKNSIYYFWNLMRQQSDDLPHNSIEQFGIYYKFSTPLILIGFVSSCKNIIKSMKDKKFSMEIFVLINFISALMLMCIMNPINVNKINAIHIPIIFYCSYGLFYILSKFDIVIGRSFILLYFLAFLGFISYYFTDYQNVIGSAFQKGYDKAIEAAMQTYNDEIYVTDEIYYPKILFLEQTPVEDFIKAKNENVLKLGRIIYGINKDNISNKATYVISDNDLDFFRNNGFEINKYDNFYVAYKKG